MYQEPIEAIGEAAEKKSKLASKRPGAYFVQSALAGAYVGLGICLIFMLGAPLAAAKSPFTSLVMGSTFGIALSLVLFAGSDLFTGNSMVLPVGALSGRASWKDTARVWAICYAGNLAGSVLVAYLAYKSKMFAVDPGLAFVTAVATKKMSLSFGTAFVRGVLCNWLVVLAVWSSFRMKSESGKLIMVFWCLLGFIGSGYEHSIANMTLLTIANLLPHGAEVSWAAMAGNLLPVTLGNILSGALFVGAAYWFITPVKAKTTAAKAEPSTPVAIEMRTSIRPAAQADAAEGNPTPSMRPGAPKKSRKAA